MNYIILSNFFVLSILTYLGSAFLPFRYEKVYKRIIIFIISFCLMTLINYYGASSFKACFIFLIMLFHLLGIYKAPISKLLFVLLPFYIIIAVSEILTAKIFNILLELDEHTKPNTIEYFFALCVSNTMAFIITIFYIKFSKIFKDSNLPKYTWLIFILPVTTIIYMVSIENYYEIYQNNVILVFILVGLFISNLVVIYIFFRVTEMISLKKEMELIQVKEQMTKQKLDLLDQYYKNNFDFLHDFLNQCNSLRKLINECKIEDLKNEMNKLIDFTYREFNTLYSNSAVLNTVLESKKETIINNNIYIKTTMEYTDFSFMTLYDQTKLYSNLLDLGIFYTKMNNNDQRTIIIKSFNQDNQIIIHEKIYCNTKPEIFLNKDDLFDILNKYSATVSTKYLGNENIMSIIISFKQ